MRGLIALVALIVVSGAAKADWPEAFYSPENERYYLPKQQRHLKHPNRVLDLQRLKERDRQRRIEREAEERRAEERREHERFRSQFAGNGPRVYGYMAEVHPLDKHRCPYPAIKVVGDSAHSEQQAQLNAETQWQKTVAWTFGERAISVGNAINKRGSCNSSVPDPTGFFRKAARKLVESATAGEKSTLSVRCEFQAVPCNAPLSEVVDDNDR